MTELSGVVLRLASTLPPAQRERMAEVLSGCEVPSETVRARLAAVASAPAFAGLVSELASAWREETAAVPGSGIALALRAAGRAVDEDRRRAVRPVWTGPDAGQPIRLDAAVVAEVIADARERLVVLSFAAYKIPEILEALEDAARRGITVDVVLETAEDSAGSLGFDHCRRSRPSATFASGTGRRASARRRAARCTPRRSWRTGTSRSSRAPI